MPLTNIEYGSIASSETMNNNFSYLDNKIDDNMTSVTSSISSILSSIATINSTLSELSQDVNDALDELDSRVETYRTKTKLLVNKACVAPNWKICESITLSADEDYEALANGYLLMLPGAYSVGNLIVGSTTVVLSASIYASQLICVPVMKDDLIRTTAGLTNAYFLPAADVSVENF